jgi:hypothetical protein
VEDAVHLITSLWPLITGLLGAYGAVAVLFYRVSLIEKREEQREERLNLWRDEVKEAVVKAEEKSDKDLVRYMDMEKAEHVLIINRFEQGLNKIEAKLDRLIERELDKM